MTLLVCIVVLLICEFEKRRLFEGEEEDDIEG